jgi:hypothetical protein
MARHISTYRGNNPSKNKGSGKARRLEMQVAREIAATKTKVEIAAEIDASHIGRDTVLQINNTDRVAKLAVRRAKDRVRREAAKLAA